MNKEEALNDFLRGLHIVLSNASAYPKDHPYFKKSVEEFKQKADILLTFINPIRINVAAESLFVDGKYWEKAITYVELARVFHLHKIKYFEIKQGVSLEELTEFLSLAALPAKEFIKQGGIDRILNKGKGAHISIEGLDYSSLLTEAGQAAGADIWVYLFKDSIAKEDLRQINELADNFEKVINKFKAKDFIEEGEVKQNISIFLSYLKEKEKDKFYKCTKQLFRFILRDRNISREEKLEKLREFFKDLNPDDFTEALLDELSGNENFDYLSFTVFSRLIDEDTHTKIAPSLEDKLKNTESLKSDPKVRKKIKELFSSSDSESIPAFYRHALLWLAEEKTSGEGVSFDLSLAHLNYGYLLINLLNDEKDKDTLGLISASLAKEWNAIIAENNLEYIKLLLDLVDKKIKLAPSLSENLGGLQERIYKFIENMAFEGNVSESSALLMDKLNRSALGFDFYREKIFNEGKVNPYILKLLLRFFPKDLTHIYTNLDAKRSDNNFMEKFLSSLEKVDSLLAIEVFKHIFYSSDNIIKMKILQSMQKLSRRDDEFLFSVLEKEEASLKKEALALLARDSQTLKIALENLLLIRSPWGRNNKVIIENIILVESLGIKEAAEYLALLARRRFFWNRNIREKAAGVLKEWHDRKD